MSTHVARSCFLDGLIQAAADVRTVSIIGSTQMSMGRVMMCHLPMTLLGSSRMRT